MSKLLINERPLQVLPTLAKKIGLNEAIALQQLHYWLETSSHVKDERKWVYNTAGEWQKNFPFWSENTIRRTFQTLREQGLVIVGNYNKLAADRTLWYSIDYDELDKLENPFGKNAIPSTQLGQMDLTNLGTAIPETTTETTALKEDEEDGANARGEVHKLWQQNMPGTLTAIIADDINDLVDTYSAEEVKLAITQAVRNNGRSIKYVQKVLENRAAGRDKQPENGVSGHKPGDVISVINQYTGKVEQVTL